MVRMMLNGVFRTIPASIDFSTYWLAFDMVIGRTAEVNPPLMPPMVSPTASANIKVCPI